jgi:hypothetical protein
MIRVKKLERGKRFICCLACRADTHAGERLTSRTTVRGQHCKLSLNGSRTSIEQPNIRITEDLAHALASLLVACPNAGSVKQHGLETMIFRAFETFAKPFTCTSAAVLPSAQIFKRLWSVSLPQSSS